MKALKKLSCFALILVLVLAMAAPALAAQVTITPPTEDVTETYTAYKIFDATVDGEGSQTVEDPDRTVSTFESVAYSIAKDSPFLAAVRANGAFVLTEDGDKIIVKVEEGKTLDAAAFADALMALVNAEGFTGTSVSSTDNKLTLDDGYFLIVGSLGSKAILDTFGKEAVNIQTKNELPTLKLEADKTSASYGEPVTYTITVHIPATAVGEITVTPTLDGEMTYADGENDSARTDDGKLVIDADTVANNLDEDVTLIFTAALNTEAKTGEENPHTTKAQLTYSSYTSAEADAVIYTYEFALIKTNSSDKILDGATFELYTAETDGEKVNLYGATGTTDGVIHAGIATVKGLAAGTYYLEETAAPEGYNRVQTRIAITLGDMDGEKNGNLATTNAAAVGETYDSTTGGVEVENLTGAELPSTGGIGTTIFYIVGGLLVVGACVLLVTRKRADAE